MATSWECPMITPGPAGKFKSTSMPDMQITTSGLIEQNKVVFKPTPSMMMQTSNLLRKLHVHVTIYTACTYTAHVRNNSASTTTQVPRPGAPLRSARGPLGRRHHRRVLIESEYDSTPRRVRVPTPTYSQSRTTSPPRVAAVAE